MTTRGLLVTAAAKLAALGRWIWETRLVQWIWKFRLIFVGQGLYQTLSFLYDDPLWWAVEAKWKWNGVVAMMFMSMLINFCNLLYNRNKEIKWLGWDKAIDSLKEKEEWLKDNFFSFLSIALVISSIVLGATEEIVYIVTLLYLCSFTVLSLLVLLLKGLKVKILGDILLFIFLSIFQDSFITTACLRHGRMDGLRARDYIIFLASSVVSIVYWAARNAIIVETARSLLKF